MRDAIQRRYERSRQSPSDDDQSGCNSGKDSSIDANKDSGSSNDSGSSENSDGTDSDKDGDRSSNTNNSNGGCDGSTGNCDDVGDGDASSRVRTRLQCNSMAKCSVNQLPCNSNRTNSLRGSADISINAAAANKAAKGLVFY